MSRPEVQPLDPDTPQGTRVARELGELLARILVDIHRRESAPTEPTEPVRVALRARRARSARSTEARRAA